MLHYDQIISVKLEYPRPGIHRSSFPFGTCSLGAMTCWRPTWTLHVAAISRDLIADSLSSPRKPDSPRPPSHPLSSVTSIALEKGEKGIPSEGVLSDLKDPAAGDTARQETRG